MLTTNQVGTLADMLTYCRPHGTAMDVALRAKYLHTIPDMTEDQHGNLHLRIGDASAPNLWSSHTDTVHRSSGRQSVHVDQAKGIIRLSRKWQRRSECLGADDTVGVFLMREMALVGVPGHYIWHYGEEHGCIGSGALADHDRDLIDDSRIAIALDRAGTRDVVTSQIGSTCASEVFARSIASQLTTVAEYSSARGVFTDTAEYMRIIPECTNLSVGYYSQHTPREYVDYLHVGRLLRALVGMDQSALVVARNPHENDYRPGRYAPTFKYSPSVLLDRRWYERDDEDQTLRDVWDTGTRTADYHSADWCDVCDARIYSEDDPRHWNNAGYEDQCICSDDDRKFLQYLRNA